MAIKTVDELFLALEKKQVPPAVVLQGEDAYLTRELKKLVRALGVEMSEAEIKKTGPEPSLEDLSMGGSLFASQSLLWITKTASLSGWKADSKTVWKRIVERADGQNFSLFVQVPQDKRMNWSGLGIASVVPFSVSENQKPAWMKRMNAQRGNKLDGARLRFLCEVFDEELLVIDNWIELWSLGGDVWAEKALGWNASAPARGSEASPTNDNPAFAWVDAVLSGNRRESVRLFRKLMDLEQEPLQLLALLSKSVRIMASLEAGGSAQGQPDFLVNKLKTVVRRNVSSQPRRGQNLLRECARLDRLLKSSTLDAEAAMMRL